MGYLIWVIYHPSYGACSFLDATQSSGECSPIGLGHWTIVPFRLWCYIGMFEIDQFVGSGTHQHWGMAVMMLTG